MKTNPNDTAYTRYEETNVVGGLTKREYFAAMAMNGIEASNPIEETDCGIPPMNPHEIAERAVRLADALIEELNKKVEGGE